MVGYEKAIRGEEEMSMFSKWFKSATTISSSQKDKINSIVKDEVKDVLPDITGTAQTALIKKISEIIIAVISIILPENGNKWLSRKLWLTVIGVVFTIIYGVITKTPFIEVAAAVWIIISTYIIPESINDAKSITSKKSEEIIIDEEVKIE